MVLRYGVDLLAGGPDLIISTASYSVPGGRVLGFRGGMLLRVGELVLERGPEIWCRVFLALRLGID